ncbi:porin [Hydrogenobaculum acidophilum]
MKRVIFTLAFSLITSNSYGVLLKASNNKFADVGLKLSIWAQDNGKITTNDHKSVNFSVENARLYFAGELNQVVQFGANIDFSDNNLLTPDGSARSHDKMQYTIVKDAFINCRFKKYFQVTTGFFLDPWSRIPLEDLYSFIIPIEDYNPGVSEIDVDGARLLQTNYKVNPNYLDYSGVYKFKPFIKPLVPLTFGSDVGNAFRDIGIAVWGDVAKHTALKYYIVIGNGRYDYQYGSNAKSNLKYGFRIELTPTFLGYKGEPDYVDKDTFFGKRKTLTFSFAYQQQRIDCSGAWLNSANETNICNNQAFSTTARAYTFDVLWEQKFDDFVPNFQAAWLDQKNLGFSKAGNNISQLEAKGYYLQTQLLYDRYVGIGKPALALRYEEDENKNYYINPANENSFITTKVFLTDMFVNYYIDNENANVSFGVQFVNPDANLKSATSNGENTLRAFNDWSLVFRTVF